jgi:hypothetical protein
MSEKKHTRFVVGGVYRQTRGDRERYSTLVGAEQRPNGRRYGTLYPHGEVEIAVVEDSDELDQWRLVSEPVSSDLLSMLEDLVYRPRDVPKASASTPTTPAVALLMARIEALEQGFGVEAKPQKSDPAEPPAEDPILASAASLSARKKG